MKIPSLAALLLCAGAACAEPDPRLESRLASPPVAHEPGAGAYGVVPGGAPLPQLVRPRLKLDTTLGEPHPFMEAQSLQPSDAILAPADAAAFEAEPARDVAPAPARRTKPKKPQ